LTSFDSCERVESLKLFSELCLSKELRLIGYLFPSWPFREESDEKPLLSYDCLFRLKWFSAAVRSNSLLWNPFSPRFNTLFMLFLKDALNLFSKNDLVLGVLGRRTGYHFFFFIRLKANRHGFDDVSLFFLHS